MDHNNSNSGVTNNNNNNNNNNNDDNGDKILKFPIQINNNPEFVQMLRKRDGKIISADTDIHQILLTFPINIANQQVNVVVDTGSRSTWFAKDNINNLCDLNSCILNNNLNELEISNNDYGIYYTGNFGASGKWSTGELSINNSDKVNFKFGLANSIDGSSGGYSWSGFSYDIDSSLSTLDESHLIDALKLGNVIDKRIFEIQYNKIDDWTNDIMGQGELTIGGYDEINKNYKFFDMVDNVNIYMGIKMNSLKNSNNKSIDFENNKMIVFDSGSTSLSLKQKYIDSILSDIKYDPDYPGFFDCSSYQDYKITFQIDDNSKIELPLSSLSWNSYQEDYDLCQLMIGTIDDNSEMEAVLGQYAMKNFNTVFNIDDKKIGLSSSDTIIFS